MIVLETLAIVLYLHHVMCYDAIKTHVCARVTMCASYALVLVGLVLSAIFAMPDMHSWVLSCFVVIVLCSVAVLDCIKFVGIDIALLW